MRILGLSCGNADGSAEILLKAALQAAEAEGAAVGLLRLDDLDLPTRPVGPRDTGSADDGPWLWDQLMDSDGLIVATPIYSRTIPGKLKLVADRLAGPAADAAFAELIKRAEDAGEELALNFPYDDRVSRPRVAGFIAVGGALTSRWKSLALPLMHQMTFSAHMAVADQLLVGGAGMPRSVLLDHDALNAARRVGRSVGSQLGRLHDDVEYRGAPGLCPLCHLSAVTIQGDAVECLACGAAGRLGVRDGQPIVTFDEPSGLERSVVTMTEKRDHVQEMQDTAARLGGHAEEIARRAQAFTEYDRRIRPRVRVRG